MLWMWANLSHTHGKVAPVGTGQSSPELLFEAREPFMAQRVVICGSRVGERLGATGQHSREPRVFSLSVTCICFGIRRTTAEQLVTSKCLCYYVFLGFCLISLCAVFDSLRFFSHFFSLTPLREDADWWWQSLTFDLELTQGWPLNMYGQEVARLVCPVSRQRVKAAERNAVLLALLPNAFFLSIFWISFEDIAQPWTWCSCPGIALFESSWVSRVNALPLSSPCPEMLLNCQKSPNSCLPRVS